MILRWRRRNIAERAVWVGLVHTPSQIIRGVQRNACRAYHKHHVVNIWIDESDVYQPNILMKIAVSADLRTFATAMPILPATFTPEKRDALEAVEGWFEALPYALCLGSSNVPKYRWILFRFIQCPKISLNFISSFIFQNSNNIFSTKNSFLKLIVGA